MDWFRHNDWALAPALSSLSAMALTPVLLQIMAPADGVLWVSLCSSDGVEQTIAVPLGGGDGDGKGDPMQDCQTACHAMCSRKDMGKAGSKPRSQSV